MKNTKKDGFTSVFIVIILSSILSLLTLFISVSLDRAADSIATTVTLNAGSSVLSECNKELHDKYGVLAFKDNPSRLSNLADYYISESIDGLNRFVHLKLNAVIVDTGYSTNYHVNDFRQQIINIGKKNLIFRKIDTSGLTYFSDVNLPSSSYIPVINIDYERILEFLNPIQMAGDSLFITQYAESNFTRTEREYLLYGNADPAANEAALRATIFGIRCLVNCVSEIEDPLLLIEAIARANAETDEIMNNELERESYIKAMIYLSSVSNKLMFRMMDIMQLDNTTGLEFSECAYSFEITAQYSRGKKNAVYTQKHSYT